MEDISSESIKLPQYPAFGISEHPTETRGVIWMETAISSRNKSIVSRWTIEPLSAERAESSRTTDARNGSLSGGLPMSDEKFIGDPACFP